MNPISSRWPQCWAALFGLLAVVMGAYASHGLKQLPTDSQSALSTAVQYQFWHALALLYVARMRTGRWRLLAFAGFVAGVLCFSGSLYILTLTPLRPGLVTPLGGLLLMLGWLGVLLDALQGRQNGRSDSE